MTAELLSMANVLVHSGYDVRVVTNEESSDGTIPLWGGEKLDLLWIHQATPNIFGGIEGGNFARFFPRYSLLLDAVKKTRVLARFMVDNQKEMSNYFLFRVMKSQAKTKGQIYPLFVDFYQAMLDHVDGGTFIEIGLDGVQSGDFPFFPCDLTSEQLRMCFPDCLEKRYTTCYIGTGRGMKQREERWAKVEPFVGMEGAFFGGSLFRGRSPDFPKRVPFDKAITAMRQSRSHIICRDLGMSQVPLHRYLQALMSYAIPAVTGEESAPDFINCHVLKKTLLVKDQKDVETLLEREEELSPLLQAERDFWLGPTPKVPLPKEIHKILALK
jgi:hypothetical protein